METIGGAIAQASRWDSMCGEMCVVERSEV